MTQSTRAQRYAGRHALRSVTSVTRCWDCGRQTVTAGGGVTIRKSANGVGYAGTATCGRVWLCPVCNAKVMMRRSTEIGAALLRATLPVDATDDGGNALGGLGCFVIWGSLTCRHNAYDDLAELLRIQTAAWRHVVSSRAWRRANATLQVDHVHGPDCASDCDRRRDVIDTGADGRVGYIRAAEVTIGSNGWHPHFHPIILWRGDPDAGAAFADTVVDLWVEGVERAGGEAVRDGAQQLRILNGVTIYEELSRYVTKATYDPTQLALETVWSQGKATRGTHGAGTVSHWSLLAGIEQGLADEAGRWAELEAATDGHRMITWSRGLRDLVRLGDEQDDEQVAAEEVGTRDDDVAFITPQGWIDLADRPYALAAILDALEEDGIDGMVRALDEHGVDWASVQQMADESGAGSIHHDYYRPEQKPEGPAPRPAWWSTTGGGHPADKRSGAPEPAEVR